MRTRALKLPAAPILETLPCPAPVRALTRAWTIDLLLQLGFADAVQELTFEDPSDVLWKIIGHLPDARSKRSPRRQRLYARLKAMAREVHVAAIPTLEAALPGVIRLGEDLGLSTSESRVLCALAARDLDREFFDLLNGLDRENELSTPRLVARWTGLPEPEVRRMLSSRRALVGLGLVSESLRERSATAHNVDDRLLAVLETGDANPSSFIAALVKPAPPSKLSPADYPHLDALLPSWLGVLGEALRTRTAGFNVLIHGKPGTGKTELCRVLAHALGAELLELNPEDADGDPLGEHRLLSAIRLTQRALGQRTDTFLLVDEADGLLPVSQGVDPFFGTRRRDPSRSHKSWLVDLLETNPMPTLWVANDLDGVHPALLRRFHLVLQLDEPPAGVKRRLIDEAFGEQAVSEELRQRLAKLNGLQPGHIEALAQVGRLLPASLPLQPLIERQTRELRSLLDLPPMPRDTPQPLGAFRLEWLNPDRPIELLLERTMRAGAGRFCLYGQPGTGKSAFAAELARRLQRPLHVCQGADLLSCFIGETEKAIAGAFARAESMGAVLLIDEVEGLLCNRQGLRQSWELSMVNSLLTSLDGYGGYVVLTTNLFQRLDPAVLRRLEHKLELRPPTAEQRRSLWGQFREHFGWAQGADLEGQIDALDGLTPGDFHQVARQYLGDPGQATPFAVLQALRAELALKSKVAA